MICFCDGSLSFDDKEDGISSHVLLYAVESWPIKQRDVCSLIPTSNATLPQSSTIDPRQQKEDTISITSPSIQIGISHLVLSHSLQPKA